MDHFGSSRSPLDARGRSDVDGVRLDLRDMRFTESVDQIHLDHLDPEEKISR